MNFADERSWSLAHQRQLASIEELSQPVIDARYSRGFSMPRANVRNIQMHTLKALYKKDPSHPIIQKLNHSIHGRKLLTQLKWKFKT